MNVTKETITPKKAMEWLKRNVHNRPLSIRAVGAYAKQMELGLWKLNGDCIRFNGNGDLIDGQHRLTACVQAGKAFDAYVVKGLDHDAFDTIDQGRRRTTGDVFSRSGYPHYVRLAAAVRNLWRYENGYTTTKGSIRPDEAHAILERHPALHAAVQQAGEMGAKRGMMHPGLSAFLLYITKQIDEEKADKFWSGVMTGEGLSKSMASYWLRERLIQNMASVARLDNETIAALSIKAWNFFHAGKPCKNLKWDSREAFPAAE